MKNDRINRRCFKNQLEKGNILVKCNGKYTDDYPFDNAYNFLINDEWTKASAQKFCDWYIKCMHLMVISLESFLVHLHHVNIGLLNLNQYKLDIFLNYDIFINRMF